ncbi:unnamed protein product [Nesidiocoris tenuis]|uniref:Uncharacterized protein n=1 Tax=Nesidiocoris tenuis TaxID=355587 RepID=A0A6H5HJA4_9HEMI|nr:unnamed protein product [Nesidiocoris tenuis]
MKIPPSDSERTGEASDFSEYMWMENEEEFDQEVMKQLEEEALMEQCIEAMLEDELEGKGPTLNPDAAEFVPKCTGDPGPR